LLIGGNPEKEERGGKMAEKEERKKIVALLVPGEKVVVIFDKKAVADILETEPDRCSLKDVRMLFEQGHKGVRKVYRMGPGYLNPTTEQLEKLLKLGPDPDDWSNFLGGLERELGMQNHQPSTLL